MKIEFINFIKNNYDEILEKIFYKRASQGVRISENARQAHTYIIGASKSGKSELIKDLIFSDLILIAKISLQPSSNQKKMIDLSY